MFKITLCWKRIRREEELRMMETEGRTLNGSSGSANVPDAKGRLQSAIFKDSGELMLQFGDVGGGDAVGSASKGAVGGEHFGIVEDFVALEAGERPGPFSKADFGGAITFGNGGKRASDALEPALRNGFLQRDLVGEIAVHRCMRQA